MQKFDNLEIDVKSLPHLITLLEDDTPYIRSSVINQLLNIGVDLEEELKKQEIQLTPEQNTLMDQLIRPYLSEKKLSTKLDRFPIFKPGMIIIHKRYNYRGLIVDIDPVCKANNDWYEKNQTQPEKNQPWYHVLVNDSGSVTYTAQTSLKADPSKAQIHHPLIPFYFEGFNTGFYHRNNRPWGNK